MNYKLQKSVRGLKIPILLLAAFFYFYFPGTPIAQTPLQINSLTDNSSGGVQKYGKLEITFDISGSSATNPQFPYDPTPPGGIDPSRYSKHRGITVDALFLPPGVTDWQNAYKQPAFIYQPYATLSSGEYPTGNKVWKVRFSPNKTGLWKYKITAQEAGGSGSSAEKSFSVTDNSEKGFVRVSKTDPRYFEFEDGTYFPDVGRNAPGNYNLPNTSLYPTFGANDVKLIRVWMNGFYGASWMDYIGGRNIYDAYLPRAGTEVMRDPSGTESITMALEYPESWYDACRMQFNYAGVAVKPNTNYKMQIKYIAKNITGPRVAGKDYGIVGKLAGWEQQCHNTGTGTVVTNYGKNSDNWITVEGTWNSGSASKLPRVHFALENAASGKVWVKEISVKEILTGGALGPEILAEPSMEYETYFPEFEAHKIDNAISLAEQNDIYLKLVLLEKGDMVWLKLNNDGTFVLDGQPDNHVGFYGIWRNMNKTRWLQQAYFRYVQARWGYSTHIHSWELINEGDPANGNHWALADEMGKFFHCRAFGISVPYTDGSKCNYDHPNDHLSSTSLWHSFPSEFWGGGNYPNVDYADFHAYISSGWLRNSIYESDEVIFHSDYARDVRGKLANKPIMRGETGLDVLSTQNEQSELSRDTKGVWLHNLLFSQLDPYAVTELYWWENIMDNSPGPDGRTGLHEIYKYYYQFIENLPLNNGNYKDAEALVSNTNNRVMGQKDIVNNRAHLWVQNRNHVWKRVVQGTSQTGISGTVSVGGFAANRTLSLEFVSFKTDGLPVISRTSSQTNSTGDLTINLPTDSAIADTAIKIGDYSTPSITPRPNPLSPDVNSDGRVNILDIGIIIDNYGRNPITNPKADINADGNVNIIDIGIVIDNYQR